jgi:spore germination protein PC
MNYPWHGYAAPADSQLWAQTVQTVQTMEKRLEELAGRLDAAEKKLAELQDKSPVHVEYHFDQLKVSRLDGTLNIGLTPQAMKDVDSFEIPVPGMWTPGPTPSGASESGPAAPQPSAGGGAGQAAAGQAASWGPFAPSGASGQSASAEPFAPPFPEANGGADLSGTIRSLQQEAVSDFDRNGPALLQSLCGQLRVDLDEQHRRMMIADVRAQLSPRVHHYARIAPCPAKSSDEDRKKWRRTVLDKTGRDVRIALTNYLKNFQLPDMGKEENPG